MRQSPALSSFARRRIFVAGHRGMVGSAFMRRLAEIDCTVLTAPRAELDLRDQAAVSAWFADHRPDVVILAAAKVGGIQINAAQPAAFLYDNLMIAANVIEAARRTAVAKLLYIASSAVYPADAAQPLRESDVFGGAPDPSHLGYAMAKLAGMRLVQTYRRQYGCDFITAVPTNLYGPGDNFDPATAHVVPGLLRRIHEAKVSGAHELGIWGSGHARRELLHVDDLVDACLVLLTHPGLDLPVNIGCGSDVSIRELAEMLASVVGFDGALVYDTSKPEGAARRLMDISRLRDLGWSSRIGLRAGLEDLYAQFRAKTVNTFCHSVKTREGCDGKDHFFRA